MKEQSKTIYKAGSYIYIEADEDVEYVYIVESGLVEFQSSTKRLRSHGNTAEAGDVFGAISSLCKRPRMETAFAKINTSLIIFTRDKFLSVLKKNSEIAIKLLDTFADELRLYDTMIFPFDIHDGEFVAENIKLFNLARYYYEENILSTSYFILNRYRELYPQGPNREEVRTMLDMLAKKGMRKAAEPIQKGIYRQYLDKQIIFCEHEPGNDLFIIKQGKVKIIKHHEGNEMILSVLSEGEIFGELAIVSDKTRNATAISYGGTVLLPIDKDSLMKLIQKSSDILKRIFTAISQRVWFTFIRMESKFYEKPITRIYVFLENKLIEDNISSKSREQHVFNFGIDELIKMTNIPADAISLIMNELTRDPNLEFNMVQTIIENPSLIVSKARYYRSRDHLYEASSKPDENSAEQNQDSIQGADRSRVTDAGKKAPPDQFQGESMLSGTLYEEIDEAIEKK